MRKCYNFLPDISINSNTAAFIILLSLLDTQPFEVGARRINSEMSNCVLSFREAQIWFVSTVGVFVTLSTLHVANYMALASVAFTLMNT